ncbi:MAG: MFS transporter, partial [Planctomycetota bacterium]
MKRALQKRFEFMNANLRILTIRQVLGMFCRRMVLSYASLYILAVGGGEAQIGVVNSLRPIAGLIMFPIAGYLTDRTGRVRLIVLAGYFSALTTLLYVFASSWEWLALAALLQGVVVFQFPPSSAILADSMKPQYRGVGIATMSTLATAFAMFSPYIAGIILEVQGINAGMRILYLLLALSQGISTTLIFKYLKETAAIEKTETKLNILVILKETYTGIPDLVRNMQRSIRALGLLLGLGFIANGIISPFWVVFVTDVIGLSSIDWGLILFFESVFKTVLTIPCGIIADRYSRTKTLFAAVLCALITLPSIIFAQTFIHVLIIRLGVGLAGALFLPSSTALMADYIPRKIRGRMMAAIGRGSVLIGAAGGGTGGPGMGYLFTIPVMVASVLGGLLYAINPTYPWICILGITSVQLLSIVFF